MPNFQTRCQAYLWKSWIVILLWLFMIIFLILYFSVTMITQLHTLSVTYFVYFLSKRGNVSRTLTEYLTTTGRNNWIAHLVSLLPINPIVKYLVDSDI